MLKNFNYCTSLRPKSGCRIEGSSVAHVEVMVPLCNTAIKEKKQSAFVGRCQGR